MLVYSAIFVIAIILFLTTLIYFLIIKFKKKTKKGYKALIILLCLTIVFSVTSFIQPRPRCCGEGHSYIQSIFV